MSAPRSNKNGEPRWVRTINLSLILLVEGEGVEPSKYGLSVQWLMVRHPGIEPGYTVL